MGLTFAILNTFGQIPFDNDKFNIYSKGGAIQYIICFNSFILIPSYPDDFFFDLNDFTFFYDLGLISWIKKNCFVQRFGKITTKVFIMTIYF